MKKNRTLDIPFFYQKKDLWCGPGATKIFLKVNYPGQIHLRKLARLIGTSKEDGTYSRGIIRACRAYGQGVQTMEQAAYEDLEQCLEEKLPSIIAYLEPVDPDGHYAVVTGLTERHIWLHDPYYGPNTKYKRSDFTPRWRYFRKWMLWPVWPEVRIGENLRFLRQKPGEWIGTGALLIMLKMYQSRNLRAQELARIAGARRTTILTSSQMRKIARTMGQAVSSRSGASRADIKDTLDRNMPCIVCYRSPRTEHVQYAVVSGLSNTHIYLHDPNIGPYHEMHFHRDFLPRWRQYNNWLLWPVWRTVRMVKPEKHVDVMKKAERKHAQT